MKKLVWLAVMMVLCSCGRIEITRVKSIPIGFESIYSDFEYNKTYTAYVGQKIISWSDGKSTSSIPDSFVSEDDFTLQGTYERGILFNGAVKISENRNSNLPIVGQLLLDKNLYYVTKTKADNNVYGLLISKDGKINKHYLIQGNMDRIVKSENAVLFPNDFKLSMKTKGDHDSKVGLRYELIYGGVNDVAMNFTYREYTPSDMARQAFFQNLVYKTNIDIIRFQNFRIKVYEATNEKIVYSVLGNTP